MVVHVGIVSDSLQLRPQRLKCLGPVFVSELSGSPSWQPIEKQIRPVGLSLENMLSHVATGVEERAVQMNLIEKLQNVGMLSRRQQAEAWPLLRECHMQQISFPRGQGASVTRLFTPNSNRLARCSRRQLDCASFARVMRLV